jgi:hypothetical protein
MDEIKVSMNDDRLSWREKFAAWIILALGFLYLAAQVINYLSSKTSVASSENGKLVIDSGELMSNVYTYIYIVIALLSGFLLLKKKKLGWILAVPFLIFFIIISGSGVFALAASAIFDASFMAVTALFVLLVLSVLFLFLPSARRKYKVGKRTLLPTLVFLMALCALFFFLQ